MALGEPTLTLVYLRWTLYFFSHIWKHWKFLLKKWCSLWTIHQCLQIICKLKWTKLQKLDKLVMPILILFIYKNSFYLCNQNMLKVWLLISNFTLFKDLIFWLNQLHVSYNSNVFQLVITMYNIKVLKTLRFFCACCYLKMHDSHSNAFVFHLFIQQLHY
jgi:hypothetical protein